MDQRIKLYIGIEGTDAELDELAISVQERIFERLKGDIRVALEQYAIKRSREEEKE